MSVIDEKVVFFIFKISVVNYFYKKLLPRCLTGFSICFYKLSFMDKFEDENEKRKSFQKFRKNENC